MDRYTCDCCGCEVKISRAEAEELTGVRCHDCVNGIEWHGSLKAWRAYLEREHAANFHLKERSEARFGEGDDRS